MTIHQAADHYRDAASRLARAEHHRAATHAAHIDTIPILGRTRVGNGSERTRRAHHTACQAAATARTHLEHARDQLVAAALEHTGV